MTRFDQIEWSCDVQSSITAGGGGSSSSSAEQKTINQDQRVAADTGSVAASGGASLSNVQVINQSSDPGVIIAALKTVEQQSALTAGTIHDVAGLAINENAAVSADAIDKWAKTFDEALGLTASAVNTSLTALANQSASTSALASQALGEVSPLQTSLKWIVFGGAAVLIVFFLSKGR